MDIEIRRAVPEEAEVLTEIAIAAKGYWGYPERWMRIWRPELTYHPEYVEKSDIWVAVIDGAPIGLYTLRAKDGNAWLEDLWVLPAQMGQGAGRALFEHALHLSKQRGYDVLRLESDPNAVGFYIKMGAHKIDQHYYDMEATPRILPIMEIKL